MNAIQVRHCCKFIAQAVFLVWVPSGRRSWDKDSLQIVHWWLSSKKHWWGVGKYREEKAANKACVIKPVTTVGIWGTISLRKPWETSENTCLRVSSPETQGSWGTDSPFLVSHWWRVIPRGMLVLQHFQQRELLWPQRMATAGRCRQLEADWCTWRW